METMRNSWTDERLDDFRGETQRRFDEVDRRFDRVEVEISDLRSETKAGFDSLNTRFDSLNARFDSLQRVMLQFSGVLIVALIGFTITQAWFMITQV